MFKKMLESTLVWIEDLLNKPRKAPPKTEPYNHLEVLGRTEIKRFVPPPKKPVTSRDA